MKKQSALHHPHLLIISSLLILFFFFLVLLGDHKAMVLGQNTSAVDEFKVGVVLDLDELTTKMGLTSIYMALSDFYAPKTNNTFRKRRLVLDIRDSNRDVVDAASQAVDLIKDTEVQAIIGPITSSQAVFMVDLGNKAHVPIISFTATSPSICPSTNQYFIRMTQKDTYQVPAIAAIVKAHGWREAVPIYEDTEYGNGVVPYLTDALQEINTRVPYRSVISITATDDQILEELNKLMTMQTRVFIAHMSFPLGLRVFQKAKMIGMMGNESAWIITDGIGNFLGSFNSSSIESMQGVLVVRPYIPKSNELSTFRVRWKKKFRQRNPNISKADLNVFGIWAYDTIWALASAVENLERLNSTFVKPEVLLNSSTIAPLGVSEIGTNLLQEISQINFKGLSGQFRLIDRQLQLNALQILNVVGNQGREIGVWTATSGILPYPDLIGTRTTYSTSKSGLRPIIWPGESIVMPKGWVIPTNEKKLRIGVPVKEGFTEFVKITTNTSTNSMHVTGYCIDVFNAAIEMLPYAIPHEFVPFQKPDGTSAGRYIDFILQVHAQNYDAVVGDVTIVANRASFVDFTLPYTESGLSMIVPVKEDFSKNAIIFLKPMQIELWLTSAAFFVFTGVVIWFLERRENMEFRGSHRHQLGTMLSFSFMTLVFAHKEKVLSNWGRFVLVIWVFVVLILTSSYTASLTSMLTVTQLRPTATNVDDLIQNRVNVGCQKNSFVFDLLIQMGFHESNIKDYRTPEEFNQAFSENRNSNDRIVAGFDEIPYINLLLARYCNKYTMIPLQKTLGFAFVFPKGSPLGPEISRKIIKLREEGKMERMEQAWLGNPKSCLDRNPILSSNSLTLDSFWILFVITGVTSIFAVTAFLIKFLITNRAILIDPDTTIVQKLISLVTELNEMDTTWVRAQT